MEILAAIWLVALVALAALFFGRRGVGSVGVAAGAVALLLLVILMSASGQLR